MRWRIDNQCNLCKSEGALTLYLDLQRTRVRLFRSQSSFQIYKILLYKPLSDVLLIVQSTFGVSDDN